MPSFRKAKLEHQIMRVVGNLLLTEIKDPRVKLVSVSRVKLSSDYSHAEIFYSVLGDDKKKRDAAFGLRSARGFVKKKVGDNLKMRHVPDVAFTYDESVEHGVDLVNLIESVTPDRDSADTDNDPADM